MSLKEGVLSLVFSIFLGFLFGRGGAAGAGGGTTYSCTGGLVTVAVYLNFFSCLFRFLRLRLSSLSSHEIERLLLWFWGTSSIYSRLKGVSSRGYTRYTCSSSRRKISLFFLSLLIKIYLWCFYPSRNISLNCSTNSHCILKRLSVDKVRREH